MLFVSGCTNKINQTGSWLVTYDSTLTPRPFSSDSVKLTTAQIQQGIPTGSGSVLALGQVPWTESDLLISFSGLDSVYDAGTIVSAQLILYRSTYNLEPNGLDVNNMQFIGFTMDSLWDPSTATADTIAQIGYGGSNVVLSQSFEDTTITINLDTSIVRQWGLATVDTNYRNYGFILKPSNTSGVVSIYSSVNVGTGYEPYLIVACVKDGLADTVTSNYSSTMTIGRTSITTFAPSGPYHIVQSGTGERETLNFDLGSVPKFSIVNYAELTLYANPIDTLYSSNSTDSLIASYIASTSPITPNITSESFSSQTGDKYVFNVTLAVQLMLNSGNNGFLIQRLSELDNVDSRFMYDELAPDSLKPKLTIIYAPVVRR